MPACEVMSVNDTTGAGGAPVIAGPMPTRCSGTAASAIAAHIRGALSAAIGFQQAIELRSEILVNRQQRALVVPGFVHALQRCKRERTIEQCRTVVGAQSQGPGKFFDRLRMASEIDERETGAKMCSGAPRIEPRRLPVLSERPVERAALLVRLSEAGMGRRAGGTKRNRALQMRHRVSPAFEIPEGLSEGEVRVE